MCVRVPHNTRLHLRIRYNLHYDKILSICSKTLLDAVILTVTSIVFSLDFISTLWNGHDRIDINEFQSLCRVILPHCVSRNSIFIFITKKKKTTEKQKLTLLRHNLILLLFFFNLITHKYKCEKITNTENTMKRILIKNNT